MAFLCNPSSPFCGDDPADSTQQELHHIAQLAQHLGGAPIVLVSAHSHPAPPLTACIGLAPAHIAQALPWCNSANKFWVVPNALQEPLLAEHPLVYGEPHIRFLICFALMPADHADNPDPHNNGLLGALIVMDTQPRNPSPEALQALHTLALHTAQQLQLRQQRHALLAQQQQSAEVQTALQARVQALQQSQERLQDMVRAVTHISWDWDVINDQFWWCDGHQTFFDTSLHAPNTPQWLQGIHPQDRPLLEQALIETLKTQPHRREQDNHWAAEYRLLCRNGTYKWVLDRGFVLRDGAGRALRIVGGVIDISAQKQAEQQYRQLFQAHPQPMWVYAQDESLRILAVNDAMVVTYGYSEAELLGMAVPDLWAPGSAHCSIVPGRCLPQMPPRHQRKDASLLDVEVSARSIEFKGQKACQIMATDVTERRCIEHKLERISRAQHLLSTCNEALVRAKDERTLLHDICRIVVDIGGYRMGWVGIAHDDAHKTIEPVAHYGPNTNNFLNTLHLSWSDCAPQGQGLVGITVRTGKPTLAPNLLTDPAYESYTERLQAQGFRGAICLPLRHADQAFGVLCLYAADVLNPGTEETQLLQALANDVAFGINSLRARQEQHITDMHMRRQASLLNKAQDAILVRDLQHRILFWNQGAERMYGWTEAQALQQSVIDLLYEDSALYQHANDMVREHGEWMGELVQKHRNGESLEAEVRLTLVRSEDGEPESILSISTNITQRKATERQVKRLAFYDALTGLPNRLLLTERMHQALLTSEQHQQGGALLFIDMDNFKTLNDTLGHDMGDLLLKQVAQRLNACVRSVDTVARLGGDEFVVVLEALSANADERKQAAKDIGESILSALAAPYQLAQYQYRSTPSIGIAPFLGNQHSVGDLLRYADMAMYQSKAAGRNTLHFFDPQMQATVLARAELETALRTAMAEGQFVLHYQPQVNHLSQFVGVEAMVRWQHPERGLILPADFIAVAEETGLILMLGRWVLHVACHLLGRWRNKPGLQHLTMAVNISPRQFRHASFVTDVLRTLAITGAPAHLLKLELTENLLIEDMATTIATMTTLRKCRVGFSLDDFGTGYSSLSYLKQMPLEQLKIDQSFVQDLLTDPSDAAIIKTIIGLSKGLDLAVIAEGVESLEQRDALLRAGCHFFQGNLFSPAVDEEKLELLLCKPTAQHQTAPPRAFKASTSRNL